MKQQSRCEHPKSNFPWEIQVLCRATAAKVPANLMPLQIVFPVCLRCECVMVGATASE